MNIEASGRQLKLLDFIIKEYVKTATPVSSGLISKKSGLDLSPATIRNEMAELERSGYLGQLHTSGGRIPTDKAYRYFVNNLLRQDELEPENEEKKKIKYAINNSSLEPREINKNIAQVLSDLSDNLVITAIEDGRDFYKAGLSSLFEMPEFQELEKVFKLTNFFDEFDRMFDQIESQFFGHGQLARVFEDLNIIIGNENHLNQIRDETVIYAKYDLPNNIRGSLTLIGPTRMNYEKNISLIKFATEELNKLSNEI